MKWGMMKFPQYYGHTYKKLWLFKQCDPDPYMLGTLSRRKWAEEKEIFKGKKIKTSEFEKTIGSPHSILQGLDIFFNVINVYD